MPKRIDGTTISSRIYVGFFVNKLYSGLLYILSYVR